METNIIDVLKAQLKKDEGFSGSPYLDTVGKTTIGYGRNLDDKPITKDEADMLLTTDAVEAFEDAAALFNQFDEFNPMVQVVFSAMCYQMGKAGLSTFRRMIFAANAADWDEVVVQMRDSKWYSQTPNRAERYIKIIEACSGN